MRLGIAAQMKGKTKISEEAVGTLVASGDAEIGFQQISELLPVPGIDYVGPLPPGVQRVRNWPLPAMRWMLPPSQKLRSGENR